MFLAASAIGATGCDRALSRIATWIDRLPERFDVPTDDDVDPDVHLLSRATFGPRPGELEALRRIGRRAWIDEQLAPDTIDDLSCDLRVAAIDTVHLDAGLAFEFPPEQIEAELGRSALLRAVYSKRQLREVMTELWADHFHVAIGKERCRHLRSPYDREVLRAHALGRFRDLLGAATKSAAMLVYLDGVSNEVSAAPNENHARELLELHTLGAFGGYTQTDVREVARCLTGFIVEEGGARPGSVSFVSARHDDAEKTVLGRTLAAGGGAGDVERVLDVLCDHPSTARRVATKIARAFVADDPPEPVVDRLAEVFRRTGGSISEILRSVLDDEVFFESRRARIKRPFRFVASAFRALGVETHARGEVLSGLARQGQSPFAWPTPDGYPERGDAWLGTLLERFRFALDLAAGELDGARVRLDALSDGAGSEAALVAHVLGRQPNEAEHAAFAEARDLPAKLALAMCSPAFQRF
jgi:uncharacterized protein (DUF1800 family)